MLDKGAVQVALTNAPVAAKVLTDWWHQTAGRTIPATPEGGLPIFSAVSASNTGEDDKLTGFIVLFHSPAQRDAILAAIKTCPEPYTITG